MPKSEELRGWCGWLGSSLSSTFVRFVFVKVHEPIRLQFFLCAEFPLMMDLRSFCRFCRLVRVYKVAAERRRRTKQDQELLELVHAGVIEVMCVRC